MDGMRDRVVPVLTILAGLVVAWYVAAVLLNAPFQRDLDRRAGETPDIVEFLGKTLSQPKPTMPAPHQVAANFFENTFLRKVTSNRSLVYHAWVTLSSTLLGFAFGTALGILIAVGIVHFTSLDRSLMPWIIASQTIPILAIAPMVIVVLRGDRRHRHHPQGADLDLSVLLPGLGRHGEGAAFAGDHASRPDAHLQCQPLADLLEAAGAGLGAVPVHLDEGGDSREPRRRDRCANCRPARWRASARSCCLAPTTARPSTCGRHSSRARSSPGCWSPSSG